MLDKMLTRRQVCALGGVTIGLTACSGGQTAQTDAAPEVMEEAGATNSAPGELTLEEKVSQLIIPSLHQTVVSDDLVKWVDNIVDLDATPGLGDALRRHQYGGLIIYGENVQSTEQVCRLTDALQKNNATIEATSKIPYLMCMDGEGGVVLRLIMGTRTTGAMAVGATGDNAVENARATGAIIGSELAAVGCNVDFAPDADVNVNPSNPVIGVRSFGDDPETVATLATAMAEGLAGEGVIPCFKHFPGHGDTSTDSHIGTASVDKTLEEMQTCEFVPFGKAIEDNADLIMTAHITCPAIDDAVTFADGSVGYYPATMSAKILTDILRGQLGYDGVIVTDSLDMGAIATSHLVQGEEDTAEYAANVAAVCLNAGADILLNPMGIVNDETAAFYDDYIDLICKKVEAGEISAARIDESVARVLRLKEKYGILGLMDAEDDLDMRAAEADATVGSEEHHAQEMAIARQAITLVKNEGALPLDGEGTYVLLVRTAAEAPGVNFALSRLKEERLIADDACIVNLITGETVGSADSRTRVTVDYYYDYDTDEQHYTDEVREAIAVSDAVIVESIIFGAAALAPGATVRTSVEAVIADAHAVGAKFIHMSANLPYDVACYTDADAQVLSYMSSGTGVDPTDRSGGAGTPAYNANFLAALAAIFGGFEPSGTLPVNVPVMGTDEDGSAQFGDDILFGRGFSLTYE